MSRHRQFEIMGFLHQELYWGSRKSQEVYKDAAKEGFSKEEVDDAADKMRIDKSRNLWKLPVPCGSKVYAVGQLSPFDKHFLVRSLHRSKHWADDRVDRHNRSWGLEPKPWFVRRLDVVS